MNTKLTKVELVQLNEKLAAENAELRLLLGEKEGLIEAFRAQQQVLASDVAKRYPLTDKLGRRYRIEGNVKAFMPEVQHV